MKFLKRITLLLLSVLVASSCSARGENNQPTTMNADLTGCPRVKITTSMGDITIVLYNLTPTHRDNFLKLCSEGFYDGVLFHRVIKDFMIQAGDPDSRNAAIDAQLGSGNPGYTLPAEIVPGLFHKRGALAAARTGDNVNPERRSSGSQFYIVTGRKYSPETVDDMERSLADNAKQSYWNQLVGNHIEEIRDAQQRGDTTFLNDLQQRLIAQLENHFIAEPFSLSPEQKTAYTTLGGAPHLDGQYTVFGEVVEGMEVVEKIQNVAVNREDRPNVDVKIIKTEILK